MYKRKLSVLLVLVLLFTMNANFASDNEQTVPPHVEVPAPPSYLELPDYPGEITTTPPSTDTPSDNTTETPTGAPTPTPPTTTSNADASLEHLNDSFEEFFDVNKGTFSEEGTNQLNEFLGEITNAFKDATPEKIQEISTHTVQKTLEAMKSMEVIDSESVGINLEKVIQAAVKAMGTMQIPSQEGVPTTIDKTMILEKALMAQKLGEDLSELSNGTLNKKISTSIQLSINANANSGMELEFPDLNEVFDIVDIIEIETPMGSVALHKDMFSNGMQPSRISIGVVPSESLPKEYENVKVMSFVIHNGDETLDQFSKPVVISIPFTLEEDVDPNLLTAFYLDDNDLVTPVPGYFENGVFIFKTNHFSNYYIASNKVDFKDVKSEWFAPFVKGMAAKGIIKGRTKDIFDPEANVTRAEFVALISRVLNYGNSEIELPFVDVEDDDWFYGSVKMLYSAGILKNSDVFNPYEAITREEMGMLLGKTLIELGYNPAQDKTLDRFTDMNATDEISADFIAVAVQNKVLVGNGGKFFPKENMTRAQAATVISILLSK